MFENKGRAVYPETFADLDTLEWLNTFEAARYLRTSVGGLRVMVHRGYVKARRFHRRLYFKRSELYALINDAERTRAA